MSLITINLAISLCMPLLGGLPTAARLGEEAPATLNIAPDECLFYAGWAAAGEPDPESSNRTEQLLADEEIRNLIEIITPLVYEMWSRENGGLPDWEVLESLVGQADYLLSCSGAGYLESVSMSPGSEFPDIRAGLIIHLGDRVEEIGSALAELQQSSLGPAATLEIQGGTYYIVGEQAAGIYGVWGVHGQYLVAGATEASIRDILARFDSSPPEWLTSLREKADIAQPSISTYLNVEKSVESMRGFVDAPLVDEMLEIVGLVDCSAVWSVAGLDDEQYVSRSLIEMSQTPSGVLGMLHGVPLTEEDLSRVPADATAAFAIRADSEEFFLQLTDLFGSVDPFVGPNEQGLASEIEEEFREEFGFGLREGLLEPLGDLGIVYASPSEGGNLITSPIALLEVDDAEQLRQTETAFLEMVRNATNDDIFEEIECGDHTIHFLAQFRHGSPVAACWCLTDDELLLALYPQTIRAYLSRDDQFESLAEVPRVNELLTTQQPVVLGYLDSQAVGNMAYPWASFFVQAVATSLGQELGVDKATILGLLPSPQAVMPYLDYASATLSYREDGIWLETSKTLPLPSLGTVLPLVAVLGPVGIIRAQESVQLAHRMFNMRECVTAMRVCATTNHYYPAQYSVDANGAPLLSWRVHLLPYLGFDHLYEQFHLDEPWDSEHNRELIELMPDVYTDSEVFLPPGMTTVQAPIGEGTIIIPPTGQNDLRGVSGISPASIRDDTWSTTLLVNVSPEHAVEWTRPRDYQFSPENPGEGLFAAGEDAAIAGFANGECYALRRSIDPVVLRALFTRAGGELVRAYREGVYRTYKEVREFDHHFEHEEADAEWDDAEWDDAEWDEGDGPIRENARDAIREVEAEEFEENFRDSDGGEVNRRTAAVH